MKLTLTKHGNAPKYGTWGEWTYGKEHGTFGRNIFRGMWACIDGQEYVGLLTHEHDMTESFKCSVKRWRDLNRSLKRRNKRMETE